MDGIRNKLVRHKSQLTNGHGGNLKSPMVKRCDEFQVALRGWLFRLEGAALKQWKRRWFVLGDYCLFYYKDTMEEKLLGSVLLPSYRVSPCVASEDGITRKFSFKLEHQNMKSYFLAADSKESMNQWMNALSLASIMQLNYSNLNGTLNGRAEVERNQIFLNENEARRIRMERAEIENKRREKDFETYRSQFGFNIDASQKVFHSPYSLKSHGNITPMAQNFVDSNDRFTLTYDIVGLPSFSQNLQLLPQQKRSHYANAPPKPRRTMEGNYECFPPNLSCELSPGAQYWFASGPAPDLIVHGKHGDETNTYRVNFNQSANSFPCNSSDTNELYSVPSQKFNQQFSSQVDSSVIRSRLPPRPHSADFLESEQEEEMVRIEKYQQEINPEMDHFYRDGRVLPIRPKSSLERYDSDASNNKNPYYYKLEPYESDGNRQYVSSPPHRPWSDYLREQSEKERYNKNEVISKEKDNYSLNSNDPSKEESLQRLLEWKQRLLTSPLSKKNINNKLSHSSSHVNPSSSSYTISNNFDDRESSSDVHSTNQFAEQGNRDGYFTDHSRSQYGSSASSPSSNIFSHERIKCVNKQSHSNLPRSASPEYINIETYRQQESTSQVDIFQGIRNGGDGQEADFSIQNEVFTNDWDEIGLPKPNEKILIQCTSRLDSVSSFSSNGTNSKPIEKSSLHDNLKKPDLIDERTKVQKHKELEVDIIKEVFSRLDESKTRPPVNIVKDRLKVFENTSQSSNSKKNKKISANDSFSEVELSNRNVDEIDDCKTNILFYEPKKILTDNNEPINKTYIDSLTHEQETDKNSLDFSTYQEEICKNTLIPTSSKHLLISMNRKDAISCDRNLMFQDSEVINKSSNDLNYNEFLNPAYESFQIGETTCHNKCDHPKENPYISSDLYKKEKFSDDSKEMLVEKFQNKQKFFDLVSQDSGSKLVDAMHNEFKDDSILHKVNGKSKRCVTPQCHFNESCKELCVPSEQNIKRLSRSLEHLLDDHLYENLYDVNLVSTKQVLSSNGYKGSQKEFIISQQTNQEAAVPDKSTNHYHQVLNGLCKSDWSKNDLKNQKRLCRSVGDGLESEQNYKMWASTGNLNEKSHEELILLLIQLRRELSQVMRSCDSLRVQMESEEKLIEIDPQNSSEHRKRYDDLRSKLIEAEKEYNSHLPLMETVEHLVKSEYDHVTKINGDLHSKNVFNKKLEHDLHQDFTNGRERSASTSFLDKLSEQSELYKADQNDINDIHDDMLIEQENLIRLLKQDKSIIENTLKDVRSSLSSVDYTGTLVDDSDIENMKKQQTMLENELNRIKGLLLQSEKGLEQRAAENAKVEKDVKISKPCLDSLVVPNEDSELAEELANIDQAIEGLHAKRKELLKSMGKLKAANDHSFSSGLINSTVSNVSMSDNKIGKNSYFETDLDTLECKDISLCSLSSSLSNCAQVMQRHSSYKAFNPLRVEMRHSKSDDFKPSPLYENLDRNINNLDDDVFTTEYSYGSGRISSLSDFQLNRIRFN